MTETPARAELWAARAGQQLEATTSLHHIVACHTDDQISLCGMDVSKEAWCSDGCTDPHCVVCDDLEAGDPGHERCACEWPCSDCDEDAP